MSEKINSKNRNILALGLASLAFGAGVGTIEASAALAPVPGFGKKPKVLVEGGNISQTRLMLEPNRYKDSSTRLKPKSQTDTEDLAVIFDAKSSKELVKTMGEPELGDSVGFIVESSVGKTVMKLVFFKTSTGKIDLVSSHAVPIDHSQELYSYVNTLHTAESYTASIAPQTTTRGPVVSFRHTNG